MKKILLLSFIILLANSLAAQFTPIPDPKFEEALIDLGIDTNQNPDNQVETSLIATVTDLNVSNRGITNLKGLEAFSTLKNLNVNENDLNELVLQNISLETIRANDCNLAGKTIQFQNSVSGSFLTNVISLSLINNNIGNSGSTISFGGVPNVESLILEGNNFGSVQLSETLNITQLWTDNCPNLTTLNSLDLLTELVLLDVSECNFSNLNVDANVKLTRLNISDNDLSAIDLTPLKELDFFVTARNNITNFDFSENTKLNNLAINGSAIVQLDLSSNNLLENVNLNFNNNLSTLNIANGNNSILTAFTATATPALNCIQVDNVNQAENSTGWSIDANANYSLNCSGQTNIVEIDISPIPLNAEGYYVITAGTNEIFVNYNLVDENGNELTSSDLANYDLTINVYEHPILNTATGGTVPNTGVDFQLITNQQVNVTPSSGGADDNQSIAIGGDGIFEANEFFLVAVSSNDPNITIKNAANGVFLSTIKIIDDEITNINLEVLQNGGEPNQNATIRLNSSLQNNTGEPMPFGISLSGGSAIVGEDYQDIPNQIFIPNGASSVEITVPILNNDSEAETLENFFANISYAGDLNNQTQRVVVQNGSAEISITDDGDVVDDTFTVTASIINAGTGPNYTIEEGQSFTLNFETGNTGTIGTEYDPIITITKDGVETTEDFIINDLDQIFTINNNNPDGTISFTAIDDGDTEGNETYTISIASGNTNAYTIASPNSFNITITDVENNNSISQVAVKIFKEFTNNELSSPYQFIEGTNPDIKFDLLNKTSSELANYNIIVSTRDGSATSDDDDYFGGTDTFTITTNDSGFDSFPSYLLPNTRNDTDLNEENESFFIDITPVDPTISLVDFSTNPNGDVLDPGETLSIEIIIINDIEYYGSEGVISFDTSLKGDVNGNFGNLNIDEGGIIEIWVEAEDIPNVEGFEFSYSLTVSSESDDDFIIVNGSSDRITTVQAINPDEKIQIKINQDIINDPNETIIITLNAENQYLNWANGIEDPGFEIIQTISYTIAINNIPPVNTNIVANINNTGGTEGQLDGEGNPLPDIFSLQLKNLDETPYLAPQDITIPVNIAPAEFSPAEPNDYIPLSQEFIVLKNTSEAILKVELPDEEEANDEAEFYTITVLQPTNFNENINLPPPFTAKIIDDEGVFTVYYTIDESNLTIVDGPGTGCCISNKVEGGDSITISFNAEKGAVIDQEYKIGITYLGATHPNGVMTQAEEGQDKDFFNTSFHEDIFDGDIKTEVMTAKVLNTNPDFNLSIKTNPVDELKKFAFSIGSQSDNVSITESRFYDPDFLIIPGGPTASLVVENDTADEEDPINNKGLVKIVLDNMNGFDIQTKVFYTVQGNAQNGQDYKFLEGVITFESGEMEKDIIIEALPDDYPESAEEIIITLLDRSGYSIDLNNQSASVSIPENDQELAKFIVTVEAVDDIIYENPNQQNTGTFLVKLDTPNDSGSDLLVNYAFIDGNAINVAQEGIDFSQNGNGILTFGANEQEKSVNITALVDPEAGSEDAETVTLQLQEGLAYFPGVPDEDTMNIISTEFDISELSATALEVIVLSNSCANSSEGDIIIKNSSQFEFEVTIQPENKTQTIGGPDEILFENLKAGTYEVTFKFKDETIDIIPPSFEINIENLQGTSLIGKQINLSANTANLTVSGSKNYRVLNGNNEYSFEFDTYDAQTLTIPISKGLNNLKVMGEALCQGVIETTINFNDFKVYPNPTEGKIYFNGFSSNEEIQVLFTDFSGKIILIEQKSIRNETLEIDISNFSPGMYLGIIKTEAGEKIGFKIIKN